MTSKIFGYCLVSTVLDLQRDALTKAGCTDIFEEKASGSKKHRPQLDQLLSQVREGDKVVVWRLDRLARSMKQLIETVEDLQTRGVELQSVTENIDTSSPGGKLVFGIFASLAEFERSLIQERVNAGLSAARKRGRIGGRPRALDEYQVKIAQSMKSNHSLSEIAKFLGVSKSTVHKCLAS